MHLSIHLALIGMCARDSRGLPNETVSLHHHYYQHHHHYCDCYYHYYYYNYTMPAKLDAESGRRADHRRLLANHEGHVAAELGRSPPSGKPHRAKRAKMICSRYTRIMWHC